MSIDVITEYILTLVPAITAIISVISSIVILIKRINGSNAKHDEEIKKATAEMNKIYDDFDSIVEQNRQLNANLQEITKQNKQLMRGLALKDEEKQK